MSRFHTDLSEVVVVTRGSDHAVGQFVQVTDQRYADSGEDEQGEGFVLDWDKAFGFSVNLIGAELGDLYDDDRLKQLCDEYFNKT